MSYNGLQCRTEIRKFHARDFFLNLAEILLLEISAGRYQPKKTEPKIWFSSMKSLCEVLSENNMRLLKIIDEEKPQSIKALAEEEKTSQLL